LLAQQSDPLFAKDAGHPGKAPSFEMLHHSSTMILVNEGDQLEGLDCPFFEAEVEQDHPPLDRPGYADQPLSFQGQPVALKVAGIKADLTLVATGVDVTLHVAVGRPVESNVVEGIVLIDQRARRITHDVVAPPAANLGLPEGALPGCHGGGYAWVHRCDLRSHRSLQIRWRYHPLDAGHPYNLS
jgi:hypothetical protein